MDIAASWPKTMTRVERAFSMQNSPAFLAGKEFIRKIKDRFFLAKTNREVPTAQNLAPYTRKIMTAALAIRESVNPFPCPQEAQGQPNE